MRWTAARSSVAAFMLAVGLAACKGDDEKSISIALDDTEVSVDQGSRDSVIVTLSRSNFEGPVTLSVEGTLPAGVTTSYSPRIIPAGSSTSRVRFIATGGAPPQSFTVTLRATADGVADKAVDIDVTVNLVGAFTLSTAAPLTVAQGGGGSATVLVNRTGGNASSVDLTVSGMPSGMTAVFAATPTSERSVSLNVAAAAGVAPGTYTLTISGAAAGFPSNATTQLAVNVIGAPATTALSLTFCANDMPMWFAYQNEGFAWQRLTPTVNAFNFAATEKVQIAYVYQFGNEFQTNIFVATRAELLGFKEFNERECSGSKTLQGTLNGFTAPQSALIAMGGAGASATGATYTLQNVPAKSLDLVGTRANVTTGGTSVTSFVVPDKMVIIRAQNPPATLPLLDFNAPESFVPASQTLTVMNFIAGSTLEYYSDFWSATATHASVSAGAVGGGSTTFHAVPGAQLIAGDMHELFIEATQANAQTGQALYAYFGAPTNRTETLGPALNNPTVTVQSTSPYARLRSQLASQPEYPTAAQFFLQQGTASAANRKIVNIVLTAAYLGGTPTTWDVTVPDLSGASGFDAGWMHAAGQSTPYFAVAYGGRDALLFGATPVVGESFTQAYRISSASTLLRAPSGTVDAPIQQQRGRRGPLVTQYLRR